MFKEIREEFAGLKTNQKALREYAVTMFIVSLLIGGLLHAKGNTHGFWFLMVGISFLMLGLLNPYALKNIYRLWMGLAIVMGFLVSRIILSILFYGMFVPVGIGLKIFQKDSSLCQKLDPASDSYWLKKEKNKFERSQLEKSF